MCICESPQRWGEENFFKTGCFSKFFQLLKTQGLGRRTLVQEIRRLQSEKDQIKTTFSLSLKIMERRDACLKDRNSITKHEEKNSRKPSLWFFVFQDGANICCLPIAKEQLKGIISILISSNSLILNT